MDKPPGICVIEAPCKINLHLAVGEKRPDGFHNLESVFACLALSDTLRFERGGNAAPQTSLETRWEGIPREEIPPENNLVLRAVSLFREKTGFAAGLAVRLTKRVPSGAGLGGGSSDAAAALLAVNLLAGKPLSGTGLAEAALLLGSDVPFFLSGGAAFVSGRGERIEPLEPPPGWVVLVKPPFFSGTAGAFRLLDEKRRGGTEKKAANCFSKENTARILKSGPENWPFRNDFLPLFAWGTPLLDDLRNQGALFAGLSGSGTCCFGVFSERETAEKAEKKLSGKENRVIFTFFLAEKPTPVLE